MTFFSCLLATLLALAPACAAKDASRLKELQRRLLDGQPLRLAALGGSSTAGHQLPRDSPLLYYNRLVGWINESHPHVETLVVNSGIRPPRGRRTWRSALASVHRELAPCTDGEISSPVLVPPVCTQPLSPSGRALGGTIGSTY